MPASESDKKPNKWLANDSELADSEPSQEPDPNEDLEVDDETEVKPKKASGSNESEEGSKLGVGPEKSVGQRSSTKDEEGREEVELFSMKKLALLSLLAIPLYLLINFFDVWYASKQEFEGTVPAAIVLGAAQYNGEPSLVLQGRLDRAADLFEAGQVEVVLVTGGGQEDDLTTEAKSGYDYLRETAGLDDTDLLLEVKGSSTYESMAAASRILENEDISDVVIVTDAYHAKRSQLIAGEVGLEAEVAIAGSSPPLSRVFRESLATSLGRLISFRRLDSYLST